MTKEQKKRQRTQSDLWRATTTLTKQNIAKGLHDLGLVRPQGWRAE